MLLFASPTPPPDADSLTAAVRDALTQFVTFADSTDKVVTTSGSYPDLSAFNIDLDDASVNFDNAPEAPKPSGTASEAFSVECFKMRGKPLHALGGTLVVNVEAGYAKFGYAPHAKGGTVLLLNTAKHGTVSISSPKPSLETMLCNGLTTLLKGQGVSVENVQLNLTTTSPRSLALECTVTASKKVGFFTPSGAVAVKGTATVDDALNLVLSGLSAEGKGGLGSMAAPMLTPYLQKYDGQKIPLLSLAHGELQLQNIKVSGGDQLELEAEFGTSSSA